MSQFTFLHNSFEFPDDVSVIVYVDEGCELCGEHYDFDFYKDGQIVSMLGGTDEDGNPLPSWEDVGIRRVEKVRYENLS